MKQLLILIIITAICFTSSAQTSVGTISEKPIWITHTTDARSGSNFYLFKMIKDTLMLADTAIHFIKIGEQVFEIKRLITLEAVENKENAWIIGDSTILLRPQFTKGNIIYR